MKQPCNKVLVLQRLFLTCGHPPVEPSDLLSELLIFLACSQKKNRYNFTINSQKICKHSWPKEGEKEKQEKQNKTKRHKTIHIFQIFLFLCDNTSNFQGTVTTLIITLTYMLYFILGSYVLYKHWRFSCATFSQVRLYIF